MLMPLEFAARNGSYSLTVTSFHLMTLLLPLLLLLLLLLLQCSCDAGLRVDPGVRGSAVSGGRRVLKDAGAGAKQRKHNIPLRYHTNHYIESHFSSAISSHLTLWHP
jgi:hypothetical protein